MEVPTDSRQDAGQGKKVEAPRARIRTKIRVKARLQTPPSLSPSKLLTQGLPRHKLRTLVLVVKFFLFNLSVQETCTSLLIINENIFLLLYKS